MSETRIITVENHVKDVMNALTADKLIKAAMAGGQVIEANAKINANAVFSSNATNTLAGSIQTVVAKSEETYAEVDVGPTVVYGRIHELGGIIKPVHAKMLSWVDNGIRIFAKLVQMPARPYLRPAVDEHKNEISDAVGYQLRANVETVIK